jgi:hypothetical protein
MSRIQEFHNIRNAIAHSSFDPVPSFDRVEDGVKVHYEAGIEFSYIDPSGKMHVPRTARARNQKQKVRKKKESKQRNQGVLSDDVLLDKSTITYSEFDEFDAQLRKIMEFLNRDRDWLQKRGMNGGLSFYGMGSSHSRRSVAPLAEPPESQTQPMT